MKLIYLKQRRMLGVPWLRAGRLWAASAPWRGHGQGRMDLGRIAAERSSLVISLLHAADPRAAVGCRGGSGDPKAVCSLDVLVSVSRHSPWI